MKTGEGISAAMLISRSFPLQQIATRQTRDIFSDQENPCAAYHGSTYRSCHLTVNNIPLSIRILHANTCLACPCHGPESLLQCLGMDYWQARHRRKDVRLMASNPVGGLRPWSRSFSIGTMACSLFGSFIATLSSDQRRCLQRWQARPPQYRAACAETLCGISASWDR